MSHVMISWQRASIDKKGNVGFRIQAAFRQDIIWLYHTKKRSVQICDKAQSWNILILWGQSIPWKWVSWGFSIPKLLSSFVAPVLRPISEQLQQLHQCLYYFFSWERDTRAHHVATTDRSRNTIRPDAEAPIGPSNESHHPSWSTCIKSSICSSTTEWHVPRSKWKRTTCRRPTGDYWNRIQTNHNETTGRPPSTSEGQMCRHILHLGYIPTVQATLSSVWWACSFCRQQGHSNQSGLERSTCY